MMRQTLLIRKFVPEAVKLLQPLPYTAVQPLLVPKEPVQEQHITEPVVEPEPAGQTIPVQLHL